MSAAGSMSASPRPRSLLCPRHGPVNRGKAWRRVVAVVAGVGLTMIGCQAYDTMAAAVEARENALAAWIQEHPEQAHLAERHVRMCQLSLNARTRGNGDGAERLSFTDCLEQAGSEPLAKAIEQAVLAVDRPLPLRLFSQS